jgi:hypothetical protein
VHVQGEGHASPDEHAHVTPRGMTGHITSRAWPGLRARTSFLSRSGYSPCVIHARLVCAAGLCDVNRYKPTVTPTNGAFTGSFCYTAFLILSPPFARRSSPSNPPRAMIGDKCSRRQCKRLVLLATSLKCEECKRNNALVQARSREKKRLEAAAADNGPAPPLLNTLLAGRKRTAPSSAVDSVDDVAPAITRAGSPTTAPSTNSGGGAQPQHTHKRAKARHRYMI